jgi:3-dehydroquinate dehydratase
MRPNWVWTSSSATPTSRARWSTPCTPRTTGPLPTAIGQVRFPVIEVHVSNPVARGVASTTLPVCVGSVTGFGPFSYSLALAAAKEIVEAKRAKR